MCTYIDEEATEKMKNKLKGKKIAYAWKVVRVESNYFYAPFFYSRYEQHNEVSGEPESSYGSFFKDRDVGRKLILGNSFHLSLTRKLARLLLVHKRRNKGNKYKVVKVSYEPKDIYCVGDCGSHAKGIYGMPKGPDTICVKAFDFVDKIN